MQETIHRQIESIIQYRKQLRELERKRSQHRQNVPPALWQEFLEVSHRLEQAEERMRQTCLELTGDVNLVRKQIISTLQDYNHCCEQMRQVDELFLVNVLRPGRYLKQAIWQREHLQSEYDRMYTRIQREGYASQQELEVDIRLVLSTGEPVIEAGADEPGNEDFQDEAPWEKPLDTSLDNLVGSFSIEDLVKEFKRLVLPRVHPDTSGTSPEVFNTVFEVYKNKDVLLMEAYIVEYRGEVQQDPEADPLENLDQVSKVQEQYGRLSSRLQRRVERVKGELASLEVDAPGRIQENLLQQRQEILNRIRDEAGRINVLREKIEGLVRVYQEYFGQQGDE